MHVVTDPVLSAALMEANLMKSVLAYDVIMRGCPIQLPAEGTPLHPAFENIQIGIQSGTIRPRIYVDKDGKVLVDFVRTIDGQDVAITSITQVQHQPKIKFVFTDAKQVQDKIHSPENIEQ